MLFKFLLYTPTFSSLLAANMFFWVSYGIFLPVLPLYYHSLGLNDYQVGLTVGALSLGALSFRIYAGKAVDRYGCVRVLKAGISFSIIVIVCYYFSTNFVSAVVTRFIHGLGVASYGAAALTMTSLLYDEEETTQTVVSIYTLFTMLGDALAASAAIWIYTHGDFAAVVLVSAVAISFSLSLFPKKVKLEVSPKRSEKLPIDVVVHDVGVFIPAISLFGINMCFSSTMTFLPLLVFQNGAIKTVYFYVAYAAAVILSRAFMNKLCDYFKPEKMILFVFILFVIIMWVTGHYHSNICLAISGLTIGMGYGLAFPVLATIVTEHTEAANRGKAFGLYTMAADTGYIVGTIGMGFVAGMFGYSAIFITSALYMLFYAVIYKLYFMKKLAVPQQ